MKRLIIGLVVLIGLSISAYAQMGMMGGQQGEGQGVMGGGQQMPMMNCPMMQQMPGQGMMQNMMQMMMNMMDMQEKMMMGAKPAEKKKMMKDLTQMKEKMQKMMSMCKGMMAGMAGQASNPQCRMSCAEQWLKKAIDLHEIHIKDPKTATETSQMEMMEQMKKAYECITGAHCGMSETPPKESESKETEKEKTIKGDEHGH